MRITIFIILVITTLQASAQSTSIYYVGHSLVNLDMPYQFKEISTQEGISVHYRHHINVGAGLKLNWEDTLYNINDIYDPLLGINIEHGSNHLDTLQVPFDNILLAEAVPLLNYDRDTTVKYASHFVNLAKAANPSIQPYLYATWEGDVATGTTWRNHMNTLTTQWEDIALKMNTSTGLSTRIIPGNKIMMRLYDSLLISNIGTYTSITDFFKPDGIHLNDAGNFVIASLLATIVHDQNTIGNGAVDAGPYSTSTAINDAVARQAIQVMVEEVACEYSRWTGYNSTICSGSLGLQDAQDDAPKFHFNPSQNLLTISHLVPHSTIYIYDIQGRCLRIQKVTNTTQNIELKHLTGGIYIAQIERLSGGSTLHEFVVQ